MTQEESKVTEDIVAFLRGEMPDLYKNFFRALKEYRGGLNEVLDDGELGYLWKGEVPPTKVLAKFQKPCIPHPVHFREGTSVRNVLRRCEHCKDWNDHDFDNNWVEVVERVIEK